MDVKLIDALSDDLPRLFAWMLDLRREDPMETAQLVPQSHCEAAMRRLISDTSLGRVVTSCVRALQAEATARGVLIEVDVDDELPPVRCAEDHVQRVLLNLLTNALRHTPSDGSVVVLAQAMGGEVHVLVEDTGEGLSLEASERMFERFWRGDPSRSRAHGNAGLGLAIARGLVEAQGGRVWAENRPEGGARVAFSLLTAATT